MLYPLNKNTNTEYKVVFKDGRETKVLASNFDDAIILGKAYALNKGRIENIYSVSDEKGKTLIDIQICTGYRVLE